MAETKPIRFVTDERLDFNHFKPLRKSYIVASSYRSGSQYLCWRLWQTGLLGAPSEILNPANELRILMERFKTKSPAEYIAKLIAHRTSRNGIFGMKAHFHHFETFLKEYPTFLETLAPVTFIHIDRRDKTAQAVSMAKALQTGWWTSRMVSGPKPPLRYDRETIANCLQELEQQDVEWRRWFAAHDVTPFEITYDELTADAERVVRSVVELMGVEKDEPEQVNVPPAEKQADETNQDWIERFRRESQAGEVKARRAVDSRDGVPAENTGSPPSSIETNFFERHHRLMDKLSEATSPSSRFIETARRRRRYDAIIGQNRHLFQNARVLDIMSSYGFWALAVLDAGAAHVVGVEPSQKLVEAAQKNLAECRVSSDCYKFVHSEIIAALRTFTPGQFDVILCKEFLEHSHLPQFFRQLSRLRPRHVILDTRMTQGAEPMARFEIPAGWHGLITAVPNHDLIAFLCEPDFRWRVIDWKSMDISDWTGVHDYARDVRRTYVLDRV
jgi:trehalose 2-sulfotransferase